MSPTGDPFFCLVHKEWNCAHLAMRCDYTDPERCAVCGGGPSAITLWERVYPDDADRGPTHPRFHPFTPAHLPVVCSECGQAGDRITTQGGMTYHHRMSGAHPFQPVHLIPDPEGYEGTAKVPCGL